MKSRYAAFALALMFMVTLAGCTERQVSDATAPSLPSTSDQVSSPLASSDVSAADILENPVLPPDQNAIKADLKKAIDACSVVFDFTTIPEQGYFDPTADEYASMQMQVAKLGFPVDARDCDMRNYEQLEAFCRDAKSGKDAYVTVYSIRNFGVMSDTFVSSGGKISYSLAGIDFDEPDSVSVNTAVEVASLELTEGGHLLFTLVADGDNEPISGGFCVVPHGEELRALRRKYIDPVGYGAGGTLTVNWDENDMSGLNWEFLFDQLIFHSTGKFLPESYNTPYPEDKSRLAIPAAEVDSVLQSYFPVSAETLHSLKRYDSALGVYAWQGFSGGGYSPTPEVTDVIENPDGSITLTVGALSLEWGDEYTTTSVITILPRSDGSFQYRSNKTNSTMRAWPND